MKSKLDKKSIKLVATTGMAIFSLFATFTGAFAWFTSINNARNNASGFGVSYDDSTITAASVYCIKYDGIYGATATKLTPGSTLTMSEYDYIFQDKNVNTPLFLRIEIEGFDKTKNLSVVVPSSGAYKTGSNAYVNNYLSNVVCTKFSYGLKQNGNLVRDPYNLTDSTYNGGNAKTIYEGMRDNAVDVTGYPFVTDTSTGAKQSTITITIPKNTVTDTHIDGTKFVCFLEFDYYVTNSVNLVDNYITSYNSVPEEPNRIFASDIGLISLRDTN